MVYEQLLYYQKITRLKLKTVNRCSQQCKQQSRLIFKLIFFKQTLVMRSQNVICLKLNAYGTNIQ